MMRIKKVLWVHEKGKQKFLDSYCPLHREKFESERNLRRSDISFRIYFIRFQSHQMPSLQHSLVWCFVWRDGSRTQLAFVSFEHPLAHEERFWREWLTQWVRHVIKRTESLLCWTTQRQQVDYQIAILRWFFKCFNQINISMQGKGKILLDVSKTLSRLIP